MRDILIEFRDNMVSRGTISQNDILSLESMIGENIITDQKAINYFTKDSTQVGTQEVKTILDNKIESIDVVTTLDMTQFMSNASRIASLQETTLDMVTSKIGGLPQPVIEFFNDPKYKNMYVTGANGEELVEVVNEHLYGLAVMNNSFFIKFKEVVGIDEDAYQYFLNRIQTEDIKESDCQYEPLLNHLLDNVVEPLTFNLLLKVKDNLNDIITRVQKDIGFWKSLNDYQTVKEYYTDGDKANSMLEEATKHMNDDLSIYNQNSKSWRFVNHLIDLFNNIK